LVVVLGTAVTVSRYMETSSHPREVQGKGAGQSLGTRLEVRAGCDGSRAHSLGVGRTSGTGCESASPSVNGCSVPTTAVEPTSASPSAFEPE
jgi:hypothetical protein